MREPPSTLQITIAGRSHHVLIWNETGNETVWLGHGFLDSAWGFAQLAAHLAPRFRVVAHDWRGHGSSDWNAPGCPYHFVDYVADMWALWPRLAGTRTHLVGHSMGGTALVLFVGAALAEKLTALPELHSLSLLEGLGPRDASARDERLVLARFAAHHSDEPSAAEVEAPGSLMQAELRLRVNHPDADRTWLRFLAEQATKEMPSSGKRRWRFDPRHRRPSAIPFRAERLSLYAQAIARPTLLVRGERGMQLADHEERVHAFPDARQACIAGAGHMLHWTHPQQLAGPLLRFWDSL